VNAKQKFGATLVGLGIVALVIGALSSTGDDEPGTVAGSSTTLVATATTVAEPSTTRAEPPSSTATSTTSSTTTTTTTTTTLPPGPEAVEAFIEELAAAIATEDVIFLLTRLHPVVIAQNDVESCRAFIESQILLLQNYRVNGPVETSTRDVTVGEQTITIDPFYQAPVAFDFQGSPFEATSDFAPDSGEMFWFANCA